MAAVTGTFTATGQSASFAPRVAPRETNSGNFNASLWGTFSATVQLERSFDNGTTWLPLTAGGTQMMVFTAACSEITVEPEPGTLYRWNCTVYTSGTVNYRLGGA